jgi:hypothetical protein
MGTESAVPAAESAAPADAGSYEGLDALVTMVEAFDRFWLLGGLDGFV